MKWNKDSEGDYNLTLATGQTAWIAKAAVSRNQKPWYGRVIDTSGASIKISAWTLKAAKSSAEKAIVR